MKKRLFILCFALGMMCVGCGNEDVVNDSVIHVEESTEDAFNVEVSEKIEDTESVQTETKEEAESSEETNKSEEEEKKEEEKKEEAESKLFEEVKNREFYFSSGAGGWRTVLHIGKDGSFSGEFSDSDMGSIGDGYPNGTYYVCSFNGKFTKPVKVDDYTYSVGIADINYDHEPGTEEIIDGILYCYSEPYGIDGANSLLLYLPGAPLSELPEEYLEWVRYEVSEAKDDKLPFYGIYNEKEQNGFSSYEILNPIDEMMRQTEETAEVLSTSLEEDPLTQTEMNVKSLELYQTWDGALNTLWAELKNTLSKDEFQKLLDEQRQWIKDKEKAVEEAGADVAGGSMEPLVRNLKAAELTEKRVYELYELF